LSASRLFGLAALGLVGVAYATRARQSFGYDELFTVWVAARPFREVVDQANLDGFTPPGFYVLVRLLWLMGISNEDLRVLPILFAGLAVFAGLRASEALFGPAARTPALLLIPGSAYLFTFAHELRPYSALLFFGFAFLALLGRPATSLKDGWAAGLAVIAALLSYLGVALIALWILETWKRRPRSQAICVGLAAIVVAAPGLRKAFRLVGANIDGGISWPEGPPALSSILFGLAPISFPAWVEVVSFGLLVLLLIAASTRVSLAALGLPARALMTFTLAVVGLDAVLPIGFAPRYFALPMSALLLLIVGALSRLGRGGVFLALALFGANTLGIFRYLEARPAAREDWRSAMARIEGRLGSGGVLLAFPFHHAAVAAHAYAPGLVLGGGYPSQGGPLFWYEPGTPFAGYSFTGLRRVDEAEPLLRKLSAASDVCLLSDEPDPAKTRRIFSAFEGLGGTVPLDTGDARLRAICRIRDRN
jgi:hypothetical protein